MPKPRTVQEYLLSVPEHAQEKFEELRQLLKSVAPNATEEVKWGHMVLVEKRILFSYSAFKGHLTFMPTAPSMAPFLSELADFKTGQDTIQFRYNAPLPTDLIERIARHRYHDVIANDARWIYKA